MENTGNRASFRCTRSFGDLVYLLYIDAAVVHDEENVVMGVGREDVFDEVFFVGVASLDARAAAFWGAVFAIAGALDESLVGNCDEATFAWRHVRL